jgi:hypothetical protein
MRKVGLVVFAMFMSVFIHAQTGSVKGFVYEKSTGEVLIGANAKIVLIKKGAQTDVNGFFNIPKVPVGNYKLTVTSLGFEAVDQDVEVKEGEVTSVKVYMPKKQKELKGVNISTKREEKKFETKVGVTKITPKELKLLPSIGGEPDIAQYLQVMPGVTFTGDQGGQLYIRGGSPIQNKILLDGMTIYNPFHSIGLYSVFETEAVRNAEVNSGGFGVEYGDRTSAIVSINTKDGNKNKLSGKIAANPILAKVFLEGPLSSKEKRKNSNGSSSFLLSLKHSYLDKTSSKIYGGLGEPYLSGLPYTFTDVFGKVSLNMDNGSKFSLFGFNFNDRVKLPASNFQWNNWGAGSNFVITPGGSESLISGGVYYSNYDINLKELDGKPRSSKINGFDANITVSSYFDNYSELKYGVEFTGFQTAFKFYNFVGLEADQTDYTTQIGTFVKFKKNFNNLLIIEPGLRFQYYASAGVPRLEPRVAAKYNISEHIRIKAATGMYSQNLISSKSDKDIVNFFTGFLTAPEVDILDANGNVVKNNIQTATHFIGGIEYDIDNFDFSIEPWYKKFNKLIALNRYKLVGSDPDFLLETGTAYGLDFTAKYAKDRIYFWGVYSYGYVDRFDGQQTYSTPFDRRHNLNLLGAYTFGKNKDLEVSARFNYGSEFPFTQTQSFIEQLSFSNGLNTNILNQNGTLNTVYANQINGGRLSPYHRLDLSAKKKLAFKNKTNMEVTVSLTNAYDRKNIFYIDRIRNVRTYQLPIFPSAGINWNF